jgi:thioesterase domain-containing protein
MQFSIAELNLDAIVVSAPLQPNVNIHGTGFAGSIYSLAVLSGWALCVHIMDELGLDGDLVVGKAEIRYRSAVSGDLLCHSRVSAEQRESFAQDFRRRGKAKLVLQVDVGDDPNAVLQATYVAIARGS